MKNRGLCVYYGKMKRDCTPAFYSVDDLFKSCVGSRLSGGDFLVSSVYAGECTNKNLK
jgi:hypothetical protein